MTDKTVTVTLNIPNHVTAQDIARVLREGGYGQHSETIEAALPPEWEEGTVAWVTKESGRHWLCTFDATLGWVIGGSVSMTNQHLVTKVEPLRVLGDDEVAVRRVRMSGGVRSSDLRRWAERHRGMETFKILTAYADALEAEER